MLRVVARHTTEAESVLVGDFPPSEIPALMEIFDKYEINTFSPETLDDHEDPDVSGAQLIARGGSVSPRLVFEILLDG